MALKQLMIVGAGGLGREVLNLIKQQNKIAPEFEPIGFVDSHTQYKFIHTYPVLGDDTWALQQLDKSVFFVLAIGNPTVKKKIAQQYELAGFRAATLIHPSVQISEYVNIGQGSIVCGGSILTTDIQIGKYCLLNLHTTIGHDTIIEDYVSISPGTNISGNVHIEEGVEIGTGAAILPGIKLGKYCFLGAGAVATKDLDSQKTYVGVPAKELKPK